MRIMWENPTRVIWMWGIIKKISVEVFAIFGDKVIASSLKSG
jgi:hypothetical protein